MMENIVQNSIIFNSSVRELCLYILMNKIDHNSVIKLNDIHLWSTYTVFNAMKKNKQIGHFKPNIDSRNRIKEWSNCKISFNCDLTNSTIYLYKDLSGVSLSSIQIFLNINGYLAEWNVNYIMDSLIKLFVDAFNVVKFSSKKSIDDIMIFWNFNKTFYTKEWDMFNLIHTTINNIYIQHGLGGFSDLQKYILFPSNDMFAATINNFLNCNGGINDVNGIIPCRFLNRVKKIHKLKKYSILSVLQFMDILNDIYNYTLRHVKKYHDKFLKDIKIMDLVFPIELYSGKLNDKFNGKRTSLFLIKGNEDVQHFKSNAIFQNLRWFFNTRYNSGEIFGLDEEYGRSLFGYGQTFHKYEDMIKWLVCNPDLIGICEVVILDPIPDEYIFKF